MAPPSAQQQQSTGASSSSAWRTPSAAVQQKYNLTVLPENFEPTEQEQQLLDMYDTIKLYEKEAARIKEGEARRKLEAAAAKYEESQKETAEPTKKKKRRRKKNVVAPGSGDVDMGEAESDEYEDSEDEQDEEPTSLSERREAKLAELREEIEEAKQKADAGRAAAAEEALRAQLLETMEDDMDLIGVSLKRKRQDLSAADERGSLIKNLQNQATPPHDFSQKLGLKSWEGTCRSRPCLRA